MHQVCLPRHPNMKNLGEILIRPAEAGDEDGILRCLAEAFGPYRSEYTSQAFADTVLDGPTLAARMHNMQVMVASSAGEIVGTVAGSLADVEGHLRGMAVLPKLHGTGLAGALLKAIEFGWRDRGASAEKSEPTCLQIRP